LCFVERHTHPVPRPAADPLHAAFWAFVSAIACAGVAVLPNVSAKILCLGLIQIAGSAFLPSYVAIPTILLNGPSVAIGIALVNSIGNLELRRVSARAASR